jgi:hypothetical protein
MANDLGVDDPPQLAAPKSVALNLASGDLAKVVRVSEARAAQGLPVFGDLRDDMTITELDQQALIRIAEIKAGQTITPGDPAAPTPPTEGAAPTPPAAP